MEIKPSTESCAVNCLKINTQLSSLGVGSGKSAKVSNRCMMGKGQA